MRASATFQVIAFVPTDLVAQPPVTTALPVGVSHLDKRYEGEVEGRSSTLFSAAYDQKSGTGTYVAMESFEGSLHGVAGTFNFAHAATTRGGGREAEYFTVVPASGTGGLTGITGTGGLAVDEDGTHRVWFDYEIAD